MKIEKFSKSIQMLDLNTLSMNEKIHGDKKGEKI